MSGQVVIIDYGLGNLRSIYNTLRRQGIIAVVSCDHEDILSADRLVLPGIGHFAEGMRNLRERNLIEVLNHKVIDEGVPILGICLGMQVLTNWSEEGDVAGLGWIQGKTLKFIFNQHNHQSLKVPHMGWNSIEVLKESTLLSGVEQGELFYFVHSFRVVCENEDDVLTMTQYGVPFVSAVSRGNIFGTQFHPEKSHDCGAQILNNFVKKI